MMLTKAPAAARRPERPARDAAGLRPGEADGARRAAGIAGRRRSDGERVR
ncbi:MAG: hypothetical protein MZU84_04635 [Sphingobacterium sp.]|nr:hypothetical protein [Sphingobacterium sp.]